MSPERVYVISKHEANASRGQSHIDFCMQYVIMTLALVNANGVLKKRKVIEFQSSS